MPLKVTCSKCDHELYEGDILKSPEDIIRKYDGRCPECKRDFGPYSETVIVGQGPPVRRDISDMVKKAKKM